MKKKICAVCIALAVVVCLFCTSAFAYEAVGDHYLFNDNGFWYDMDGISPEYGWVYAPNGTLLQEGFLRKYEYNPERGMATVMFEGGNEYHVAPSNTMYRTYSLTERQALGRP